MTLALADIHALAVRYCPRPARWEHALAHVDSWAPAHELGHLLVSSPSERKRSSYGLVDYTCRQRAHNWTAELAAMRISKALLMIAGRPDLVEREERNTPGLVEMAPCGPASWRLVLRRRLWPLPRTRAGLERLLERRLGR